MTDTPKITIRTFNAMVDILDENRRKDLVLPWQKDVSLKTYIAMHRIVGAVGVGAQVRHADGTRYQGKARLSYVPRPGDLIIFPTH